MSKHRAVCLSAEERTELAEKLRTNGLSAREQNRVRILLLSDRSQGERRTDQGVADAVMCSKATVVNVRHRYLKEGLAKALTEKARPGAVPKITGEVEAKLVLLACSTPPEGSARWTLRLLQERVIELEYLPAISHVSIGEVLKKTKLSLGR
jgi:putative transposase